MKKLLLTLCATLALVACSGNFQTNNNESQKILRSKFAEPLPDWARQKLTEENGKTYFVSEIVRDETNDNTAHLERIASLSAASQLAQMAAQNINSVISNSEGSGRTKSASSSINDVSETDVKISTIVPTDSYWQLIQYAGGKREYHAYARVRIKSQELVDAMARSFENANPDFDKDAAKAMVEQASENMGLSNIQPNEKIF